MFYLANGKFIINETFDKNDNKKHVLIKEYL